MVKAIIFDCFGVLTDSGFRVFLNKYYPEPGKQRTQAKDIMDKFNAGLVTYSEFIDEISEFSNVPVKEIEQYLAEHKSNEPLFELIRDKLKPKYKIGMLSNSGGNWINKLFSKGQADLLDDIVLSFEHGVIKPQKQIYLLAAKRLGVKPQECVFIDDNGGHCEGAKSAGMQAIWYQDFAQMKAELEDLLSTGSHN